MIQFTFYEKLLTKVVFKGYISAILVTTHFIPDWAIWAGKAEKIENNSCRQRCVHMWNAYSDRKRKWMGENAGQVSGGACDTVAVGGFRR
jgi:hypothetical protein